MHYHKLLLDGLRFVVYEKGDASLTEELLTKAVTVNKNLKSHGLRIPLKGKRSYTHNGCGLHKQRTRMRCLPVAAW